MLGISPETVRLHLLRIGSVLKTLYWVSHILIDDLKLIPVKMCQTMLTALRVHQLNQWHSTVTGDESWFYSEYIRDRLWVSSLDNSPGYANGTIATEKHMLTVFWNPDGFQVVTILRTGASFNSTWFIYGNLVPF
jgi:hypothetical protein